MVACNGCNWLLCEGEDVAPLGLSVGGDLSLSQWEVSEEVAVTANHRLTEMLRLFVSGHFYQNVNLMDAARLNPYNGMSWARVDFLIPHILRGLVVRGSLETSGWTYTAKVQFSSDGLEFVSFAQAGTTDEVVSCLCHSGRFLKR